MKSSILILTLTIIVDSIQSADILAVIPTPFYSHQATFRPLWRELAKRGHKITLITTDLMEVNENITQIDYKQTYNLLENSGIKRLFQEDYNMFEMISKFLSLLDDFYDYQLRHPELMELIEKRKKFDLMFVELLLPLYPLLSLKFDCPYIGLNTMDAQPFIHGAVGNAEHPSIYPYVDFGFGTELTFIERLISSTYMVSIFMLRHLILDSLFKNYAMKYLGIGSDIDTSDIYRNASLIFINANPIFFPARPVTPITINLEGGLHLVKPQKLQQDIQDYLDDSKDGCIYFSFGTTVNSTFIPEESIKVLLQTFEELSPLRVLWKFDKTDLPNKPKNVEIRKWLPQQDVLRHRNIKMFITQGGLQSMEEAIDSAVPMLGMPFYGDQKNNVRKMVTKKFGLQLDAKALNRESLKSSISEILKNPMYKKNIEKLSAISKDHPMRGLEKAIWWTEYVLRHGGTEHLRSPSADIPLYQYFFLDILAFVLLVLILIIFSFYMIFKCLRFVMKKFVNRKNKVKTS